MHPDPGSLLAAVSAIRVGAAPQVRPSEIRRALAWPLKGRTSCRTLALGAERQ